MNFLVRLVKFCAQTLPFYFFPPFAIIIKLYAKVRINLTACYIVHEIQNEMPIDVGKVFFLKIFPFQGFKSSVKAKSAN